MSDELNYFYVKNLLALSFLKAIYRKGKYLKIEGRHVAYSDDHRIL